MSKTKKKSGKAQHSPQQVQLNALKLLKTACDLIVGEGQFKKFSEICQLKMVCNRVPTLKLKTEPGSGISPADLKMYNEIFSGQLKRIQLKTVTGREISLYSYLREGILLINYVEVMDDKRLRHYDELKQLFSPYCRATKKFTESVQELVQLLYRLSSLCSSFLNEMMCYKVDGVAAYSGDGNTNEVLLKMVKPLRIKVQIKEISREVIQLCWPDFNGNLTPAKAKPSKFGLKTDIDQELEVYIQRHALLRLEERIGVVTGISHYSLYTSIMLENVVCHSQGSSTLIEYDIYGKKLGYLVCSIHEGKIIIRTFLFLTNDGTPEGKKLSELTRLELLDKQFLGIDALEGFIRFGIADDPALTELFTQAGCSSLLDLEEIKPFVLSKVSSRDLAMILQYLIGLAIPAELAEEALFVT